MMNKSKWTVIVFLAGCLFFPAVCLWAVEASSGTVLSKGPDGCLVPVADVLHRLEGDQPPVLVDVRPPEEYEAFRIPGSLNIPLFAVKTRRFLKERKIVLLGKGYEDMAMEEACRQLRDSGFRVSVLNGGLWYWIHKGGKAEGDIACRQKLGIISPGDFFAAKDALEWLVLDLSPVESFERTGSFFDAVHIPLGPDQDIFVSRYETAVRERGESPFLRILVFTGDGSRYDDLAYHISRTRFPWAWFLEGGLEGYRQFLADVRQMQAPSGQRIRRTKECPACPSNLSSGDL